MICLTGDVHHMSMRTLDQKHLSGTEAQAALEYVNIARTNGLKVTVFVTGRSVVEETGILREVGSVPGVEFGGHGMRGRRPRWLYEILFRRVLGRQNGPAFYQAREIRRTCRLLKRQLGATPRCWRDHAFKSDRNTRSLLAAQGIGIISDEVDLTAPGPRLAEHGLVSLPMNVWPDHDTLVHGPYRGIRRRTRSASPSGLPRRFQESEGWLKTVEEQVQAVVRKGGLATLLVHPACMEVADGFETFKRLCRFLADYKSITAAEAMALPAEAPVKIPG
jgi:hypothetical protein